MKLLPIILLVLAAFFVGCGGGGSDAVTESSTPSSRANTPQPTVADESLRPPKPPSI
ncbi:MAG: hypothetical protein U9P71_08935 [Campylobacterota bacterium]|nr:hypothetical protein [Campylobacterota bacterium]